MRCEARLFLLLTLVLVSVVGEHEFGEYTEDINTFYSCEHEPVVYDAFFGQPLTSKRSSYLDGVDNGTELCTVTVEPCRRLEGRRVDGTCSNPKHPSRGARLSPLPRMLPAMFGPGNTIRKAEDGSELPSTRLLRTTLLADGYQKDHHFSILSSHIFVFSIVDNVDLFYLLRYTGGSDCCLNNQVQKTANPQCIPIPVPQNDPYLRGTGIHCLNLTRVETFQDFGCLPHSLPAERYNRVTPLLDLSVVYGNTKERNDEIRDGSQGLLKFKMEGDREVPDGQSSFCFGNQPPETSCYNYGDDFPGNLLPGSFLPAMWFFREHNRLARKLCIMNPCWSHSKVYQIARQINIAQWQYIFYYELIGAILGHDNALAEGIIYDTYKHVNDFNPEFEPGVFREYLVASRWFHTYQPSLLDLYRNKQYLGSRASVYDGGRSGILPLNNTEGDLTEGSTIQPADGFDNIIDPDLAERVFGNGQTASDLIAIDMSRGRDAGLPPYNYYRKLCGMKEAHKWKDFRDTISKDNIERLRRIYTSVNDVDLMVAIHLEKLLPGAFVGPTLYCILAKNLLLWRKSDLFFFEHGGFPAALTEAQLYEVKQHSIARILCDNGDGIKEIQPQAMLRRNIWNAPVPCREIKGADLMAWKDYRCYPGHKCSSN